MVLIFLPQLRLIPIIQACATVKGNPVRGEAREAQGVPQGAVYGQGGGLELRQTNQLPNHTIRWKFTVILWKTCSHHLRQKCLHLKKNTQSSRSVVSDSL